MIPQLLNGRKWRLKGSTSAVTRRRQQGSPSLQAVGVAATTPPFFGKFQPRASTLRGIFGWNNPLNSTCYNPSVRFTGGMR